MRDTVFISYSHSDREWLDMLKDHLAPYKDSGALNSWVDLEIKAGDEWLKQIEMALDSAKVAVLLVSPKFLNSEFIKKREIPPLLEAAKEHGLRIIWFAVTHCSWDETWLKDFQAAHDPRHPLDGLEESEQNRELVKICKKIKDAAGAPSSSVSNALCVPTVRAINPTKRCDRKVYLTKFRRFFNAARSKQPGRPHVYLIHGNIGECHDTLTDRMYDEVIEPVGNTEQSPQGLRRKKPDLKWPTPHAGEERPAEALERMKAELQEELSADVLGQYRSDFSAAALADSLTRWYFVVLEHTVTLERLGDFSTELLDWYLNEYWAALASVEAPASRPRPQVFCLIKIIYPEPGFFGSFFRSSLFDPNKRGLQTSLKEVAARANDLYPCMLLDELLSPPASEVYNWYTDNGILEEEDRIKTVRQIYKRGGRKINMAMIEKQLGQDYRRLGSSPDGPGRALGG